MNKKNIAIPLAALALVITGGATTALTVAHADTGTTTSTSTAAPTDHQKPAAMGKVTAVNGDTITIQDQRGNTTYTVDATNATITKHAAPITQGGQPTNTTITVAQVAVGDMIAVQGTLSGTNVAATSIDDGMGFGGMHGGFGGGRNPGVQGTVTGVSGNTITVTGKDGKTYTVDASSATEQKMETITTSDIQVGDTIGVQGTVSGTSVTAKDITDGVKMPAGPSQGSSAESSGTVSSGS